MTVLQIIKQMKINILETYPLSTPSHLVDNNKPLSIIQWTGTEAQRNEQTTLSRFFLINRTYNKLWRSGTVFNEDDYSRQSSGQRIIRRTRGGKGLISFPIIVARYHHSRWIGTRGMASSRDQTGETVMATC